MISKQIVTIFFIENIKETTTFTLVWKHNFNSLISNLHLLHEFARKIFISSENVYLFYRNMQISDLLKNK